MEYDFVVLYKEYNIRSKVSYEEALKILKDSLKEDKDNNTPTKIKDVDERSKELNYDDKIYLSSLIVKHLIELEDEEKVSNAFWDDVLPLYQLLKYSFIFYFLSHVSAKVV